MFHTIPGTLRTINPYRATGLPEDAATEAISDWCWMDTVLHPYDQRTLCEAHTPMTVNTFFVLQAAGVDSVRIAKIDWEAEDRELGEWLSQPIPKPTKPTTTIWNPTPEGPAVAGYTGTSTAEFVEYHVGKPYSAPLVDDGPFNGLADPEPSDLDF